MQQISSSSHTNTEQARSLLSHLRIAELTESTLAGTGRHVLDVVGTLARWGVGELHLVHSLQRADAAYRQRLAALPPAVRQTNIPMRRSIAPIADTQAVYQIAAYLRCHERFDVVHVHSSKAGALGSVAARLARARRIVLTLHAPVSAGLTGRQRMLYLTLERLCGRLAHRVVAVSQGEYDYMQSNGIAPAARLHLVPNSIVLPDLAQDASHRARLRAAWGLAEHTRLIGSIGRISAQKDPLLFVALAARRARRYTAQEERYIIVGEGDLLETVRNRVQQAGLQQHMIIAGFRTDIDAILASLDIYVLHSRYEAMPYTLLEAMGHALPIVATQVAGVTEMIADGGVCVQPGDVAALDKVLDQLTDPNKRQAWGRQNRLQIAAHYSLDGMIEKLLGVYVGTDH